MEQFLESFRKNLATLYPYAEEYKLLKSVGQKSVVKLVAPSAFAHSSSGKLYESLGTFDAKIKKQIELLNANTNPFFEPISSSQGSSKGDQSKLTAMGRPQLAVVPKKISEMSVSSEDYFRREREASEGYNDEDDDDVGSLAESFDRASVRNISQVKKNILDRFGVIDRVKIRRTIGLGITADIDCHKSVLFKNKVSLSSLFALGLSISDIAALWDIKSRDDVINLSFKPFDLLTRELFPSSLAKTLYQIDYGWLKTAYHVKPSFFAHEAFGAGDLIHYDFPIKEYLSNSMASQGMPLNKSTFLQFNVTYKEWLDYFNVPKSLFKELRITNLDAILHKWGKESLVDLKGEIALVKYIEVENDQGRIVKTYYWDYEEYPDIEYVPRPRNANTATATNDNNTNNSSASKEKDLSLKDLIRFANKK